MQPSDCWPKLPSPKRRQLSRQQVFLTIPGLGRPGVVAETVGPSPVSPKLTGPTLWPCVPAGPRTTAVPCWGAQPPPTDTQREVGSGGGQHRKKGCLGSMAGLERWLGSQLRSVLGSGTPAVRGGDGLTPVWASLVESVPPQGTRRPQYSRARQTGASMMTPWSWSLGSPCFPCLVFGDT